MAKLLLERLGLRRDSRPPSLYSVAEAVAEPDRVADLNLKQFRLQDSVFARREILLLMVDEVTRESRVRAVDHLGNQVREWSLPKRHYFSVGYNSKSNIVLLHSFERDSAGLPKSVVIGLDPDTGTSRTVGCFSDLPGRVSFLNGGLIIRSNRDQNDKLLVAETWNTDNGLSRELTDFTVATSTFATHFEVFNPNHLAVVPVDGQEWFSVSRLNGVIERHLCKQRNIDRMVQIVGRAMANRSSGASLKYGKEDRKPEIQIISQIAPLDKGFVALGGVRESQRIAALPGVLPFFKFGTGEAEPVSGLMRMPQEGERFSTPRKLIVDSARIGVITAQGQMAWYENILSGGRSNA